jgi:hypothetical protein
MNLPISAPVFCAVFFVVKNKTDVVTVQGAAAEALTADSD